MELLSFAFRILPNLHFQAHLRNKLIKAQTEFIVRLMEEVNNQ